MWCPGTALWLVCSIRQKLWSPKKRESCHSEHTTRGENQLLDSCGLLPWWSATCSKKHRFLGFYHEIWFCWWAIPHTRSWSCSWCPSRTPRKDWSQCPTKPFRIDWKEYLPSSGPPGQRLTCFCRETCRRQWSFLLLWHFWGFRRRGRRLLRRSSTLWGRRSDSHCFWGTGRQKWQRVGWRQLPAHIERELQSTVQVEDISWEWLYISEFLTYFLKKHSMRVRQWG